MPRPLVREWRSEMRHQDIHLAMVEGDSPVVDFKAAVADKLTVVPPFQQIYGRCCHYRNPWFKQIISWKKITGLRMTMVLARKYRNNSSETSSSATRAAGNEALSKTRLGLLWLAGWPD